ncbi:unnamed protein product [Amaranthus hypochondriacus]
MDGDLPPFWQPQATITRRIHHQRRRASPFLNSSLLIIILPSLLLLFVIFIFIPFISSILPQIQKIISIKRSWDSLNIILVLSAILCGVFAKRNDDVPIPDRQQIRRNSIGVTVDNQQTVPDHDVQDEISSSSSNTALLHRSKSSVPQWFEYSQQQRIISSSVNQSTVNSTGISRLRRTVSSDPYIGFTGNNQFRFFDDLDISRFYPKEESQPTLIETQEEDDIVESDTVKEIPVDDSTLKTRDEIPSPIISPPKTPPRDPPTVPPSPPPPPPPPPPAKQRRTFQNIPRQERAPVSPPRQPPRGREEKRRSSRKRMNATKEIATALVSLYSHRKRKRRAKMRGNHEEDSRDSENQSQSQLFPPPSPPPPPPPLPPPPSVFQSWFKKGSRSKKIHSLSSIPPPPTPPTHQKQEKPPGKPPLPRRREIGNESPMNGIPPSPPPPPFKMGGMKFPVVGGGYINVKIQSVKRRDSEMDGDDESMSSSSEINGTDVDGMGMSSVTCPSPDVNSKADTFIAKLHDGWRLEKINSWREKHNMAGNGSTSNSRPISKAPF